MYNDKVLCNEMFAHIGADMDADVVLKVLIRWYPLDDFCPPNRIGGGGDAHRNLTQSVTKRCGKCGLYKYECQDCGHNFCPDCVQRLKVLARRGRPFTTTDHESLVAPAHRSQEVPVGVSWVSATLGAATENAAAPGDWTDDVAVMAADEWVQHGQDEHASIASFSRFSLDLLRFAAPPGLIAAAHRAAADEVRHAVLAFGLAGGPARSTVEVEAFPVATVELSPSIRVLASRVFEEGCVGESVAVAGLAYALKAVHPGSPAFGTIAQLLEDEAQHAVQWATKNGAAMPSVDALPTLVSDPRDKFSEPPPLLSWAGLTPKGTMNDIEVVARCVWITPWSLSILHGDADMPEVSPPRGPIGEAIADAVLRIQEALKAGFAASFSPGLRDQSSTTCHEEAPMSSLRL